MEYLNDDIDNEQIIPSRDDEIYERIENIPAYSLSQSIAFFMAIRNQEANDLLEHILNLLEDEPEYSKIANILHDKFGINDECIAAYIDLKFNILLHNCDHERTITGNIEILGDYGVTITDGLVKSEVKLTSSFIGKIAYLFYMRIKRAFYDETTKTRYIIADNGKKIILDYNTTIDLFDTDFKEFAYNYVYKDSPKLSLYFNEPELILPKMKKVNVDLNLSLFLDQLIEQVKVFKKASSNGDNTLVKSKEDYLSIVISEDEYKLKKSDIKSMNKPKKTNTILADKFFVYDVIRAMIQICMNSNKKRKEDYKNKIENINKSLHLNAEGRKEAVSKLNDEDHGIIPCESTEYFKDKVILDVLGKSESTIKSYYYEMEKFIEGMEYKRLVSDSH